MTILDIELAIAKYFNPRVNIIVPNVSWGMFEYELDMLVITPSGYAYEVEIKTSKADLIRDSQKQHGHKNEKIRKLYFAVPEKLRDAIDRGDLLTPESRQKKVKIPDRAGLLIVSESLGVEMVRPAQNHSDYKFTDTDRYAVARLGTMRIWTLKNTVKGLIEANK